MAGDQQMDSDVDIDLAAKSGGNLEPGRIRLMLSGGGHRSMLGSIGAILYLVQSNRWSRVDEVVSVSGGSLPNVRTLAATDESDAAVITNLRGLYDSIRNDRVRPWRSPKRAAVAFTLLAVPAALVVLVLGTMGIIPALASLKRVWLGLLIGFMAPFVLSQTIRRSLSHYLQDYTRTLSGTRKPLDAFANRSQRQHVICATGLQSGKPYFFWGGGEQFDSGGDLSGPRTVEVLAGTMGVPVQGLSLDEAAFASSSLPGLGRLRSPSDPIVERKGGIEGEVLIDAGFTGKFGDQLSDRLSKGAQPSDDPTKAQIIAIDGGSRAKAQGSLMSRISQMSLVLVFSRWLNLSGDAMYVNDLIDITGGAALVRLNDLDTAELCSRAVAPLAPATPSVGQPTQYPQAGHLWGRFNELRTSTGEIGLTNVNHQRGFDAVLAGYVGSYLALEANPDGAQLYELLRNAGELFGVGPDLAEHWDPEYLVDLTGEQAQVLDGAIQTKP